MKKFCLPFALALTLGLAACSSDDAPGTGDTGNVVYYQPTKASKVEFYSNDINLSSDPNVSIVNMKAGDTTPIISFESTYTPYTRELIMSVYDEKVVMGGATDLNKDFLFWAKDDDATFYISPFSIYSSSAYKKIGVYYYDEKGVMQKQVLWDAFNFFDPSTAPDFSNIAMYVTVKKGYKFGFFWDGKDNNNRDITIYSGSSENTNKMEYAGAFEQDAYTFLFLKDNESSDNFHDLVFVCEGLMAVTNSSDIMPAIPEPPVTPDQPAVSVKDKHVEVNLALNAVHEECDWIESQLSIHLRDTTDAEIFLPVPAEYYCPEEDMTIVQKHDKEYIYNNKIETASVTVAGKIVTVNIKYEANGIRVTTDGLCKEVLDYCQAKYGDGLTFEVRNYYNDVFNHTQLIDKLNTSTVKFLDANPDQYVYAKDVSNGVVDPLACTVKPFDTSWAVIADGNGVETDDTLIHIYEKVKK